MLAAITLLTLITLCYAGLCSASPFGRCRKCEGLGFHLLTTRTGRPRRGKACRRCKGAGVRLRLGRRAYNAWNRLHRDTTR